MEDDQVAPITIADDNSGSDIKLNFSNDESNNMSGLFMARQANRIEEALQLNRKSELDLSSKLPQYRPQTAENRYLDGIASSTIRNKGALKAFCDEDAEASSDGEFAHNASNRNQKPSFLDKPNFSR